MTDLLARIERGEPVEAQEIFDYAVGKVIEQGAPAMYDGDCVYRAPCGRKCAFGHLIPDSLYDSFFENVTSAEILDKQLKTPRYSPALAASLERHLFMIGDMQRAHDGAAKDAEHNGVNFLELFRHNAEAVAKDHGLTFNF